MDQLERRDVLIGGEDQCALEEPAVVSVPVFTIQDPLAVAGAVALDCRPPLLPVSMDISGVDLSAGRLPATSAGMDGLLPGGEPLSKGGGGLVGTNLSLAWCGSIGGPRYRPRRRAADTSWFPVGGRGRVHASFSDVGRGRGRDTCSLGGGVLPAMVTPIANPAVGFSMSPATYPVPPVPMMSIRNSILPEVAPPADLAVGSPAWSEIPLRREASPASVASSGLPPSSSVLCPTPDVDPPSGLAAIEQELPWSASLPLGLSVDSPLLPATLTPSRMVEGVVAPESVLSSLAGGADVAGGSPELPDLSLEGPFDVHQDRPVSGASPRVLDGMRGCQYRMTSYDQECGGPDFSTAYGVQLHDPWLLEYVGAPELTRLLSRSPEYWLHHLGHEKTLAAALQLQHDAGLIQSNVQVLQQFVASLNRTSSEVMRVAFGRAPFPADAMQQVVPSYRIRRAAHYMAAMGLWRPPSSQGVRDPCH